MKRIIDAVRRWWCSGGKGEHAKPRYVGRAEFIDLTDRIIPRKPVSGRPPWETAPSPAICLMPVYLPDPPQLHPFVQAAIEKHFGTASVNEFVVNLMGPVWAGI